MIGSARTERCAGLTVTQPASTRTITMMMSAEPLASSLPNCIGHLISEVDPKSARIRLRVLQTLRVEQRHVCHLEAHENSPAQGHQDAATCARHVEVLALEHERVGVGSNGEPAAANAEKRTERP